AEIRVEVLHDPQAEQVAQQGPELTFAPQGRENAIPEQAKERPITLGDLEDEGQINEAGCMPAAKSVSAAIQLHPGIEEGQQTDRAFIEPQEAPQYALIRLVIEAVLDSA